MTTFQLVGCVLFGATLVTIVPYAIYMKGYTDGRESILKQLRKDEAKREVH